MPRDRFGDAVALIKLSMAGHHGATHTLTMASLHCFPQDPDSVDVHPTEEPPELWLVQQMDLPAPRCSRMLQVCSLEAAAT